MLGSYTQFIILQARIASEQRTADEAKLKAEAEAEAEQAEASELEAATALAEEAAELKRARIQNGAEPGYKNGEPYPVKKKRARKLKL